jgi:predicted enzyme related to lactoylglutathione lyase
MSRTRLRQARPIFPVKDLKAALDHYASLGFAVRAYADGAKYGFIERDEVALRLTARSEYYPDSTVSVAYLVVEDADQLAAEWAGEGIGGHTHPPIDTPWGMREGRHFDPDGNLLRFGSPATTSTREL